MRTLPTGSVDPNFGRRVRNRRQLNSLQNTWPYGYSMPIAVRYTQDAFSRSGWLWPVDAKGVFFQAEDGIRDLTVIGVQTCALPISLVMAASGIHAESAETPTEVLRRLEASLADELASTEMFLTVFYAVVDPKAGRITFANAGHAHAFFVSTRTGRAVRLEATRPPLGLATAAGRGAPLTRAPRGGIICLFTDGGAQGRGGGGGGGGG